MVYALDFKGKSTITAYYLHKYGSHLSIIVFEGGFLFDCLNAIYNRSIGMRKFIECNIRAWNILSCLDVPFDPLCAKNLTNWLTLKYIVIEKCLKYSKTLDVIKLLQVTLSILQEGRNLYDLFFSHNIL